MVAAGQVGMKVGMVAAAAGLVERLVGKMGGRQEAAAMEVADLVVVWAAAVTG